MSIIFAHNFYTHSFASQRNKKKTFAYLTPEDQKLYICNDAKVWGKIIIKMRIDEGKIIITKMLDKLRAQFRMKENIYSFVLR